MIGLGETGMLRLLMTLLSFVKHQTNDLAQVLVIGQRDQDAFAVIANTWYLFFAVGMCVRELVPTSQKKE